MTLAEQCISLKTRRKTEVRIILGWHGKHYRNFRADLYFDTYRRHVDNLSYFCGNTFNAFGGLFYIVENKHDEDKETSRCDPHIHFKLRLRT